MSTAPQAASEPFLRVSGLSVEFGTPGGLLAPLRGFGFDVREKEVVSFIGPSGCGKSTILNVLSGLLVPRAGEVRLQGRFIAGQRTHAAYMFQDHGLLPWRTVLQNVLLPAELDPAFKSARARQGFVEKARGLLDAFGLDGAMHQYPAGLSGGMKRRVSLARTFMADKPLYLFDEPFTGLDLFRRLRLEQILADFLQREHKTCLIVTHDLETAVSLSHRIFLLEANPCRIRREIGGLGGPAYDIVKVRATTEFRETVQSAMETLSEIFDAHAPES